MGGRTRLWTGVAANNFNWLTVPNMVLSTGIECCFSSRVLPPVSTNELCVCLRSVWCQGAAVLDEPTPSLCQAPFWLQCQGVDTCTHKWPPKEQINKMPITQMHHHGLALASLSIILTMHPYRYSWSNFGVWTHPSTLQNSHSLPSVLVMGNNWFYLSTIML